MSERLDKYQAALDEAALELDEVMPIYRQFQERVLALKLLIKGAGTILGKYDDLDDRYKFLPKPSVVGKLRTNNADRGNKR